MFIRCLSVIHSCITAAQLKVAERYIWTAEKRGYLESRDITLLHYELQSVRHSL